MLVVLILVRVSLVKAAVLTTEFLEGTRVGKTSVTKAPSKYLSVILQ
jgi:hypothetical protein